uniref:NADH dehydrogenase subunit 6 n=1 Tax=Tetragnatha sp. Rapa Nui TaxID=2067679 RepID=A0A2I6BYQ3_9ARAC|nr:NADH dehydrogenase subunit 6 [Tetragnatha sp. Rapa Nui]
MAMFLGMMIVWGSHPLLMMGGLVILVLMVLLYLYYNLMSFWVGYLLVLVMLSGILVIFSYMLSLIPNLAFEEFNLFMPLLLFIFAGYSIFENFYMGDMSMFVYMIWWGELSFMTFYLVSLLLLLMVIVLFLSIMGSGSLRIY